jgi:hypothetical protein
MLPTRVIDLGTSGENNEVKTNIPNKSSAAPSRYVALSYCWGESNLILTKDKLPLYMSSLPLELVPQTIKDAMTCTRKLGFR